MKKRTKILSIILALVLAVSSIVTISLVSTSAESFTDENGIKWNVAECYPGWAIAPADKSQIVGDITVPDRYNGKMVVGLYNPYSYAAGGAFYNCTGLTSIVLPDSITEIGKGAFCNCTNLNSVVFGNYITRVESAAFSGCTSLTSVTIPDTVVEIGAGAYTNCSSLATLNLGSGVEKIEQMAFENCISLTAVDIPTSVSSILQRAFWNCSNLTNVTIPDSVTYLEPTAFPEELNIPTRGYQEYANEVGSLFVPNDEDIYFTESGIEWCLKEYKDGWAIYSKTPEVLTGDVEVPSEYNGKPVVAIGDCAFRYSPLTSVTIPDTVVEICSGAFDSCTNLTSVTIPASCTYLGSPSLGSGGVFSNCTSLQSVEIAAGVEIIGTDAFSGCTSLTSVTIPDTVVDLREHAFDGCSSLSSVSLGNSINSIKDETFDDCTSLTSVTIPDSVTTIGEYAFDGCKGLTSLKLGNNVETIGYAAFRWCTALTSVTIPDSVTHIGYEAFRYDANAFDKITIGKNVKYVAPLAFADFGELEGLCIECESLSSISSLAFMNDTFKNTEVGSTVNNFDGLILSGNNKKETITLGSNVTNIHPDAFYGNTNMTINTTEDATVVIDYANKNNIPLNILSGVDVNKNVNFEVTCDKTGYEFTVYKVADLETTTHPYEVRYDSLIDSVDDEIFNGDSEGLLAGLDEVPSSELLEVVGTYSTDEDGASKLFENLEPGIYYVRATDFPANVYWVQNSVFALPYFNENTNWWEYEIDPIPLATKVDESDPEIVKTITNSTKDNVNFTDVSLGDTVNFEIEASRVGSANEVESKDFKLKSYVVSDIMESGLTLNQDSFVVTLEDLDGNTIATLEDTTDYIVNIVASEGVDTTFTVSLTPEYLQETEFYSSANVVIAYSAVLNEYSTREFDGNFNTATNLTYSNKTDVSATVDGNTVYAYTFGIEVNKYDDAGTPLAGSDFALYLTEDDAKAMKNEIATGTSTDTGKVEFFTTDNDVIKLQSGTYYIVETKATESYNRYTDVIPVTITIEYGETEANGTYILSAPENGIQMVEVKNSKVLIPNTGGDGALYRYLIAVAFAMLAITLVVLKKKSTKKATAVK